LADYRRLVMAIKARHPGMRWTITALPSWLGEADCAALFEAADGVVLQVHSLHLPERPELPVVLCDVDAARVAVGRMARMGVPYHVALNTYGCEVFFDEGGKVVEVVSEDVHTRLPGSAVRRSAGISEAVELAMLVEAWRREPPRGLRGVVWYRLPLETDRRNWRWVTWRQVARGVIPQSDLRVVARASGAGVWDVVVENAGERDERLPEWIAAGCGVAAHDGMNGYVANGEDLWLLEDVAWPWLAPGASITMGWVRPDDPAIQPEPSIVQSP